MELGQVLYGLFLAGAVYGGIRADLKAMHERMREHGEAMLHLHRRIDDVMKGHGK